MEKKIIFLLLIFITLTACVPAKTKEDESIVNKDEEVDLLNNNKVIVPNDIIKQIEALDITVQQVVETYRYDQKDGNHYVYYLPDNYNLEIYLGETEEKTFIYLIDNLSSETMRLCHVGEWFADMLYAKREGRLPKNEFYAKSSDKKNYVKLTYEVYETDIPGSVKPLQQFSLPRIFMNDGTELIPKESFYEFNSYDVKWSPNNRYFTLTIANPIRLKEEGIPFEELGADICIYDIQANDYNILSRKDLYFYEDKNYVQRVVRNIKWSPDGNLLLIQADLEDSTGDTPVYKYFLIIYDFINSKIIYTEEIENYLSVNYYNLYNSRYLYNFDWNKIKVE